MMIFVVNFNWHIVYILGTHLSMQNGLFLKFYETVVIPLKLQINFEVNLRNVSFQYLLTDTSSEEQSTESSTKHKIKDTDKEFCQLFSLPNSECPLPGI